MQERPSTFASYLTHLLSQGRVVFSSAEAQEALGVTRGALLDAAEKQQRRGSLIAPRRSFYVIVPPQFLAAGAPPPSWYIDSLMRQEQRPYYVGLLKAAELHGATHQAVMEFQVVTDKQLPAKRVGRSLIVFYFRQNMEAVEDGLEDHKTDTGRMKVSGVELTALDLLRYSACRRGAGPHRDGSCRSRRPGRPREARLDFRCVRAFRETASGVSAGHDRSSGQNRSASSCIVAGQPGAAVGRTGTGAGVGSGFRA